MLFMMPWIIIAAMLDFGAFVLLRRPSGSGARLDRATRRCGALVVIGILYYLFIHIPRPDGEGIPAWMAGTKGSKGTSRYFAAIWED